MRLPRINFPKPVLLFLAGALVGSFFTLRFTEQDTSSIVTPQSQGGVLGESIAPEQASPVFGAHEAREVGDALLSQGFDEASRATVARVIDGDTVELEGGVHLRYTGIDAPEMGGQGRTQCLAEAAKAANVSMVEGREVELEIDVSNIDRFGRSLRYVHAGELFVNAALVEQGFARATAYPPDTKFETEFKRAEERARAARLGMWGSVCESVSGEAGEDDFSQTNSGALPHTCEVKGNISTAGEKIYHLPGCRSYDKTVISTSGGERWFCSEEEAQNAGWRRAKDC